RDAPSPPADTEAVGRRGSSRRCLFGSLLDRDPIVGRDLNSSVTQERSRVRCQKLERFLALLVEFLQDFAEFLVGQQFVHVTHELLEGCRPVMLFHGRLPLADRWLPFCRYPPPARNVRKMTCKER